jgi:hypothetical protein
MFILDGVLILKLLMLYIICIGGWGFVLVNVLFVLFLFSIRVVMLQISIRDTDIYQRWDRIALFPELGSFNYGRYGLLIYCGC